MSQAQWMEEALALAAASGAEGEIPVGAVIVDRNGTIIGRGRNRRESGVRFKRKNRSFTCGFHLQYV
jgi:tRNA(Arg) A34 adenosine deaminase TadA